MIVTIDGPAGAGKSSAARELAQRLHFSFLDTGAMYRAVALGVSRSGIDWDDADAIAAVLPRLHVEFHADAIHLDGADVGPLIRTPELSQRSSQVATIPAVREYLVHHQRMIGERRDLVTEGRDQGTVVFPHAEHKFFLDATEEERARRRHRELVMAGSTKNFDDVLHEQRLRDRRDAERHNSPMAPAPDAVILDTTHLSFELVLHLMELNVRRWLPSFPGSSTKLRIGRSISG